MDKVLAGVVKDIANKHLLDIQEVERVLSMPYKMMRERIQELELKGHLYNEVESLKINFNMPVLFKMYLNQYKLNLLNGRKDDSSEDTED